MTRIFFLRHGEANNDKLTSIGKKQAKKIVKQLDYENIAKIYCSPLDRCKQTADIIAKKLNLDVEIINDLKERTKILSPVNEQEKEVNENYLNYNYKNPNYDTCFDHINRNFKAFNQIIDNHIDNDENILIIAHSSTIYALNAYICGIPENGKIHWMRVGNCSKVCYEISKKHYSNK